METTGKKQSPTIYFRIDPALRDRLVAQCERLNITVSAALKQATVKFVEEEEQIEAEVKHRSFNNQRR